MQPFFNLKAVSHCSVTPGSVGFVSAMQLEMTIRKIRIKEALGRVVENSQVLLSLFSFWPAELSWVMARPLSAQGLQCCGQWGLLTVMGRAWPAWQVIWSRTCFTTSCQSFQTSGDGRYVWLRRNADICTALMELLPAQKGRGMRYLCFSFKHLLSGVGCWGELLFLSGLFEDSVSLSCTSTEAGFPLLWGIKYSNFLFVYLFFVISWEQNLYTVMDLGVKKQKMLKTNINIRYIQK